jgi:hypothetical protein
MGNRRVKTLTHHPGIQNPCLPPGFWNYSQKVLVIECYLKRLNTTLKSILKTFNYLRRTDMIVFRTKSGDFLIDRLNYVSKASRDNRNTHRKTSSNSRIARCLISDTISSFLRVSKVYEDDGEKTRFK